MNVSPLQNHVTAGDVPLERLAGSSQLTQEQKIAEASRQFEALLVRQILRDSQKTVIKSSFSDNSTAASIYHDLVSNQLAEDISKSGGIGLAKTLQRQLTSHLHRTSQAGTDRDPAAPSSAPAEADAVRPLNYSARTRPLVEPPSHLTAAATHHP
jgi:flagellar protein FlgJ